MNATITAEEISTAMSEIGRNTAAYHGKITTEPGADLMMQITFETACGACGWAEEFGLEDKVRFAAPVTKLAEPAVLLVDIADYIALDD